MNTQIPAIPKSEFQAALIYCFSSMAREGVVAPSKNKFISDFTRHAAAHFKGDNEKMIAFVTRFSAGYQKIEGKSPKTIPVALFDYIASGALPVGGAFDPVELAKAAGERI